MKELLGALRPRISTKIYCGFGITMFLLVVIAVVSINKFEDVRNGFSDYRSLARHSTHIGRIQANLLEARLQVKNFIIDQSDASVVGVKARAKQALVFIQQAKYLVENSVFLKRIGQRKQIFEELESGEQNIIQYLGHFDEVLEWQNKIDRYVRDDLDVVGVKMDQALNVMLDHARLHREYDNDYWAGMTVRHFLLMRFYTRAFLVRNDNASIMHAKKEGERLAALLRGKSLNIRHVEFRELHSDLIENYHRYRDAIDALEQAIYHRNHLIEQNLDVIGPRVARAVESGKLELLQVQDTLGLAAEEFLTSAKEVIILVCLFSFTIGMISAVLIGRSISVPITSMTHALRCIADGNKSISIPGQNRSDEIGDMAKAAQIFKEKTIEAESLWKQVIGRTKELQQATCQLHTANASLKNEIQLRKSAEMQLFHTQKLESLGTLAGGIAHDFNNMLFVIITNAQMAIDKLQRGQTDVTSLLERIDDAAQRSQSIVNQVLSFSRSDNFEKIERMDLCEVIRDALTLSRAGVLNTILIETDIPQGGIFISGDVSKIQQAIINLVNNAYYACEESKGTISIVLNQQKILSDEFPERFALVPGPYAKLSIRDSGIGISENDLPKIFDPFFTTKDVGNGTGLGLSVVYGTITSCNGVILCDSKLGDGTTFTIYLPISC